MHVRVSIAQDLVVHLECIHRQHDGSRGRADVVCECMSNRRTQIEELRRMLMQYNDAAARESVV